MKENEITRKQTNIYKMILDELQASFFQILVGKEHMLVKMWDLQYLWVPGIFQDVQNLLIDEFQFHIPSFIFTSGDAMNVMGRFSGVLILDLIKKSCFAYFFLPIPFSSSLFFPLQLTLFLWVRFSIKRKHKLQSHTSG